MTFSQAFFEESLAVVRAIDTNAVEACALGLGAVRDHDGRLFILGVGGSALPQDLRL
jgi:D-sedoheptulose 7-phosphate isomerase